jgi:hypothetical protein
VAWNPARLWSAFRRRGRDAAAPDLGAGDLIPAGLSIRRQPVLTEQEALYYNLLRLTVQDQYLLFAQVPLWCLLEITGSDRQARAVMLNRIALKRVDFALVHPGSLALAKVIELDDPTMTSDRKQARDRLVEALFAAADVELIRLDLQHRYTVPQLAELLGLASEE